MGRDTFDAVLASTPLNGNAGSVTSRGTSWTPKQECPPDQMHWTAPPPMIAFTEAKRLYDSAYNTLPNLTGEKFGRFTVIGVLDDYKPKRGLRWVVRCACGDYEARKSKTIRKFQANPRPEGEGRGGDRCHNCDTLLEIRRRYRLEGGRPVEDFFQRVGP